MIGDSDIANFLSGKSISLVGNSESIFNDKTTGESIDQYDIVCRFNLGRILDSDSQGKRTDILFTSILDPLGVDIIEELQPEVIVWVTPKTQPSYLEAYDNFYRCPVDNWKHLYKTIGARPSTGCMALNMLVKKFNCRDIKLFGFDFFKTNTFYNEKNYQTPHTGCEEDYIKNILGFAT